MNSLSLLLNRLPSHSQFAALLVLASALCCVPMLSAQSGLPQNLPAGLPADLLLRPFDADFVWVEQWGSNDFWGNPTMWRSGDQVNQVVGGDNSVLIANRDIYRLNLQALPTVPNAPPNAAGARVWVGTAEPAGLLGNDNIDVGAEFVLGELTVQNVSAGVGRSFRSGGTLVFDSGDPARNARIVHLGNETSEGEDMNARGGTNIRLLSDTELYLLNTSSRVRVRENSRIAGSGDLILNPGDHAAYTGDATGQGISIQRELRLEDTARLATQGSIVINAARLRLVDFADVIDTAGIWINPEGQLQLERSGAVTYGLGNGPIRINSAGHGMDGGSNGAIRQEAGDPGDVATVGNPIEVLGDSRIHARSSGRLVLAGNVTGSGELRKTGAGILQFDGEIRNAGGLDVTNGTVQVSRPNGLPFAPLYFGSEENARSMIVMGDQTVSSLNGDAPDPEAAEALNTLILHLGGAGTTFTVDQAIFYEGEAEGSTRFQGNITGAGGFRKSGDGILRFTRWPKTYTGPTRIAKGVLEVSESAALAHTASITVEDGGQLRLSTRGSDVHYQFGGDLLLSGSGRGGAVTIGEEQGILGALRYDPGAGESIAKVWNDITLVEDASVHINGLDKTLILPGSLRGPGTLSRTGGGELVLRGQNQLGGGTRIEHGITRLRDGATLGRGPLSFVGAASNATLDLGSGAQIVSDFFGGGTETVLLVRSGAMLVIDGGLSSLTEPFRGVLTGGGSIVKRGAEAWRFEGFLSGLSEIVVEGGIAELVSGGSQIGSLHVAPGGAAELFGLFTTAPLRVDGAWMINHSDPNGLILASAPVAVAGEVRFSSTPAQEGAPVRVDQRLIFEAGSVISLPSIPRADQGEVLYSLFSVGEGVDGLGSALVATPIGTHATLEVHENTIQARVVTVDLPSPDLSAVFADLEAMGPDRYRSSWLGLIDAPEFSETQRWFYAHEQTWWWLAPGVAGSDAWFYDIVLGWVWTGASVYPFVYSSEEDAWLYHGGNTEADRNFYHYGESPGWIDVPFLPEA